jgi:hypothetical protein
MPAFDALSDMGFSYSVMELGHLALDVSIEASAASIPPPKMGGSPHPSRMW